MGFRLGAYDRTQPLVIDPVVDFASFLGGAGFDSAYSIATDSSGSVYVAGETESYDFPGAGSGPARGRDAFVCKLSPTGSSVLYTTILSGSGNDVARAVAVDGSGIAAVVGSSAGPGFPVTAGALNTNYGGLEDAFVARLDAGGMVLYATYLGAGGSDVATSVVLTQAGEAFIAGYTSSWQFPTTSTAPQRTHHGGIYDGFLLKLTAAGALSQSTLLGGAGNDTAQAIAATPDGSVCLAGYTSSGDFPLVNAAQARSSGGDAFVTCWRPSDSTWLHSTYLGGMSVDEAYGVAVDVSGDVYVVGSTASADFPVTVQAFQPAKQSDRDAFVAKQAAGNVVYATFLGGGSADTAASYICSAP